MENVRSILLLVRLRSKESKNIDNSRFAIKKKKQNNQETCDVCTCGVEQYALINICNTTSNELKLCKFLLEQNLYTKVK